jgi:hypothetical protein
LAAEFAESTEGKFDENMGRLNSREESRNWCGGVRKAEKAGAVREEQGREEPTNDVTRLVVGFFRG